MSDCRPDAKEDWEAERIARLLDWIVYCRKGGYIIDIEYVEELYDLMKNRTPDPEQEA